MTKDELGRIGIGMTVGQGRTASCGSLGDLNDLLGDGGCPSTTTATRVNALFTGAVLARIYVDTSRYRTPKGIRAEIEPRMCIAAYGRNVRSPPAPYGPAGRF